MDRDSAIQPLNKRGQVELEIGNVGFWAGGRTRVLGETTPGPQSKRENQQQFIYSFGKDSPSCLAGMSATEHHVPY